MREFVQAIRIVRDVLSVVVLFVLACWIWWAAFHIARDGVRVRSVYNHPRRVSDAADTDRQFTETLGAYVARVPVRLRARREYATGRSQVTDGPA